MLAFWIPVVVSMITMNSQSKINSDDSDQLVKKRAISVKKIVSYCIVSFHHVEINYFISIFK
jgi:hypothetical protein